MKSYLQKETEVRQRAELPTKSKRPTAKVVWVSLALLIVGGMLVMLLSQPTIRMKHDEEAIASSVEVSAALPNGDEIYTKDMQDGEYAKAVQAGSRLIEQNFDGSNYRKRGDANFMLQNYEAALHDYQEASKINLATPNEFGSITNFNSDYSRRADAYLKMGNYREAVRDYRITVATSCYSPNALGAILIGLSEFCQSTGFIQQSAYLMKAATDNFSEQPQFNGVAR